MGEDGRRANITGIKGNYKAIVHCIVAVQCTCTVYNKISSPEQSSEGGPVLEFLNNLWGLGTE
jgi:hypothetical protein